MEFLERSPVMVRARIARRRVAGLTLVEMMVSIAIAGILMSSAYSVYSAATQSWTKSRRRIDMAQRGRVALTLITRCVRAAHVPAESSDLYFDGTDDYVEPPIDIDLLGDKEGWDTDVLTFRTNAPLYLFGDQQVPDQAEIEFYLETGEDEETEEYYSNLMMRIDGTPDYYADDGGWLIEVAEGVREFNVKYFDGEEWLDSWLSDRGVPKAVDIMLVVEDLDKHETPMAFSRLAQIEAYRKMEGPSLEDIEKKASVAEEGENQEEAKSEEGNDENR